MLEAGESFKRVIPVVATHHPTHPLCWSVWRARVVVTTSRRESQISCAHRNVHRDRIQRRVVWRQTARPWHESPLSSEKDMDADPSPFLDLSRVLSGSSGAQAEVASIRVVGSFGEAEKRKELTGSGRFGRTAMTARATEPKGLGTGPTAASGRSVRLSHFRNGSCDPFGQCEKTSNARHKVTRGSTKTLRLHVTRRCLTERKLPLVLPARNDITAPGTTSSLLAKRAVRSFTARFGSSSIGTHLERAPIRSPSGVARRGAVGSASLTVRLALLEPALHSSHRRRPKGSGSSASAGCLACPAKLAAGGTLCASTRGVQLCDKRSASPGRNARAHFKKEAGSSIALRSPDPSSSRHRAGGTCLVEGQ